MKTICSNVDLGRGPQIEGYRLTAMDAFIICTGTRFRFHPPGDAHLDAQEFDAVVEYVDAHRDELRKKIAVEERITGYRGARSEGMCLKIDESIPTRNEPRV